MSLTLDGSISFIGTEFIKLLATGSSNLATEEYVDDAIAEGGGGGAIDAYTNTETDNLLNAKLNVNISQDITGNLRLDPTNGNNKIIIHAVAPATATDDFYCNGNGQFNGSLKVSLITSDSSINGDVVNADTFNSHIPANPIIFKHNDVEYMQFNNTNDAIELSKDINLGTSTLQTNTFNDVNNNVKISFKSDTFEYMKYENSNVDATFRGLKILDNLCTLNIYPDSIRLPYNNKVSVNF